LPSRINSSRGNSSEIKDDSPNRNHLDNDSSSSRNKSSDSKKKGKKEFYEKLQEENHSSIEEDEREKLVATEDHEWKSDYKKKHNLKLTKSTSVRQTFADFRGDPIKLKTKSVLYILLSILGVAYAVTCFYTSVRAYMFIGKNPLALTSLIHNWRSTPIIDIKTQNGPCTSGYTELIERTWPGSKEGCN